MMACGSERPASTSSSSTLSNMAESEPSGLITGRILGRSLPNRADLEAGLLGMQPVDIAAQGVDLAIVGQVAVGVGAVPGGEGVGAEARMDHRQGAFDSRVGQLGEERAHLGGGQHAFVDQGLEGQAADVELLAARQARSGWPVRRACG